MVPAALAVSVVLTQQFLTGGEHPEDTLKRSLHSLMPDGTEETGMSQKKKASSKQPPQKGMGPSRTRSVSIKLTCVQSTPRRATRAMKSVRGSTET